MPTNTPGILLSNQLDKEVAEMGVLTEHSVTTAVYWLLNSLLVNHLSFVHGGGTTKFCFLLAFGCLR